MLGLINRILHITESNQAINNTNQHLQATVWQQRSNVHSRLHQAVSTLRSDTVCFTKQFPLCCTTVSVSHETRNTF